MKILLSAQIRDADAYTIKHEPVPSIDLMERAATAFVNCFVEKYPINKKIMVFAGPGNNGGDGLAIGRMLLEKGYSVGVYVVGSGLKTSPDFRINLERLQALQSPGEINGQEDIPEINNRSVVVDALFGSGLTRPVEGIFAEVIRAVNRVQPLAAAVDIASGLFSDSHTASGEIMRVNHTISFQVPKLAFLMRDNFPFVGRWEVVDIGLDTEFISAIESPFQTIDKELVSRLLPQRSKFSHKGDFGKAMIVAGSRGKMGAAVLCSRSCLKTGIGLLTVHIPECGYSVLQTSVPEAMTTVDPSVGCFSESPEVEDFDAIGLGPGLGTNEKTLVAFRQLLERTNRPIVIDADGINMLAMEEKLVGMVPGHSILTPHPKEFERLAGSFLHDFDRLEKQMEFAKNHRLFVVVKGAHTTVATPDGKVYFNTSGNPGMATAGSGDVLTGMTTALLGQTKDPFSAAVASVYLHGLAGDSAAFEFGEEALIASDIIDHIGRAFKILRR